MEVFSQKWRKDRSDAIPHRLTIFRGRGDIVGVFSDDGLAFL